MSLSFTIPGEPFAWQRVQERGRKKFNSTEMTAAKETIAQYAGLAIREQHKITYPAGGKFWLGCAFYLGTVGRNQPHDPDLDNMVKLVKDALNGVVWHDDRQVRGFTPGTKKVVGCDGREQTKIYIIHEAEMTAEQLSEWGTLPE